MGTPRTTVWYEDVQEGEEASPLSIESITRTHIVRYAGASGDFNPLHHDEPFAQRVGYPSVFAMGMMTAGFLGHMLTDWMGLKNLRVYRVRFLSLVWPGDDLTCKGKVVEKHIENGRGYVHCDLTVENQRGEVVISGYAKVELPLNGH